MLTGRMRSATTRHATCTGLGLRHRPPASHASPENETLDDRPLEGVWLGNDLSTPMFWIYSFKLRKVVRLSDPRHFERESYVYWY